MQIAVDQADPAGLAVQRPGIAVRRLEYVDRLIAAGHPAEPGIGHRRLGGGDRDETGQRLAGVAGSVALDRSVERAALIGRGGHRNALSYAVWPAAPRKGCSALNVAMCRSAVKAEVAILTVDADI